MLGDDGIDNSERHNSGKYVAAIFGNFLLLQEVGNADEFGGVHNGVHSFSRLSPHYAVLQQKRQVTRLVPV